MDIASFIIYCIIVTFTPGPSNIIILSLAQNVGARKTLKFVYGATAAFSSLITISVLLNSTLTSMMPKYLQIMRVIGSLYIGYLAFKIFFANTKEESSKGNAVSSTFLNGFILQYINPKVVLFTMTVIPSFVLPYYNTKGILSIFIIVLTLIGFLAFSTWVLFGSIFKKFLIKYQSLLNKVTAIFLVYFAMHTSGIKHIFFG